MLSDNGQKPGWHETNTKKHLQVAFTILETLGRPASHCKPSVAGHHLGDCMLLAPPLRVARLRRSCASQQTNRGLVQLQMKMNGDFGKGLVIGDCPVAVPFFGLAPSKCSSYVAVARLSLTAVLKLTQ